MTVSRGFEKEGALRRRGLLVQKRGHVGGNGVRDMLYVGKESKSILLKAVHVWIASRKLGQYPPMGKARMA